MRPCPLLLAHAASAWSADFHASDYGAKGDGVTLNTAATQKGIDAAAKVARGTDERLRAEQREHRFRRHPRR